MYYPSAINIVLLDAWMKLILIFDSVHEVIVLSKGWM